MTRQSLIRLAFAVVAMFAFTLGYWCGVGSAPEGKVVHAQSLARVAKLHRTASRTGGEIVYTADSTGKLLVWEVHVDTNGVPTQVQQAELAPSRGRR